MFGIIYGIFNYLYVRGTGTVVYDVLDWDPITDSLLLIFGLMFLCSIAFYIFLKISRAYNAPKSSTYEQSSGGVDDLYQFIEATDIEFEKKPAVSAKRNSVYVPLSTSQKTKVAPMFVYMPRSNSNY